MNVAIIPARGGSKRIPRKNIKEFCGKPMIAYAINSALKSDLFEHVIVSTDDQEIAEIARTLGAETPFIRPAELSDDHTPTVPVIAHAISICQSLGWEIELACCIYPCVPFMRAEDISSAYALLKSTPKDYCFPVTEFPSAIQRALRRFDNGCMQPFYPQYEMTRTQDLELAYYDAGQFYWGRMLAWLSNAKMHSGGLGFPIPNSRDVDIDTPDDWRRAEIIYNVFKQMEKPNEGIQD
ncbi:MAG: pseudaminic acid cytidylyltransferase [Desulfuromonadaceae bacterium]|nr:pseudaminic acid cytidylyltransferase [Desulfuromonadaceae bacterium]